jgi:secondary thiamine-phosphate synthase enzyme
MAAVSIGFGLKTKGNGDLIDITEKVSELVRKSGVQTGTATVFVPGSTAGLTTVEYEPGLIEDIEELFERVVPMGREYHHNLRWHDGNGHAHVRASLLGPSLTVPFSDGKLQLGVWQQVVLIDFDNRPRDRDVVCQIIGE